MENKIQSKTYAYFAAANGYSGFRSYFNGVFNPTKYSRLFILKGGPGTGKSTLMRELYDKYKENGVYAEMIYCSSDTSSLDGVILESEKGRIAVIDGTAPHSTDPIYPGCIDEIVNLGEYWNGDTLSKERVKIEELTKEKKSAYNRAYSFLSLAGKCSNEIDTAILDAFEDRGVLNRVFLGTDNFKLVDSFGKDGLYELDTLVNIASSVVGVVGVWNSDQAYLKNLISMYSTSDVVIFPSVFSDSKIKAVYIKSEDIAYISSPSESINTKTIIDASDLLNHKKIKSIEPYLEKVAGIKESLLWHSSDEFKKASNAHFMLEDIYKSVMDFSRLKDVKEKMVQKISNILF